MMRRPSSAPVGRLMIVATVLLGGCSGTGGGITRITSPASTTTTSTTSTHAPTETAPSDATDAAPGGVGAIDVGDALTPGAGNGGYDVESYALDITVGDDPAVIEHATTTITATATADLTSFHLDLAGLDVGAVTVDEQPATTARDGDELVVTPRTALRRSDDFVVVVQTSGRPEPVDDPSAPGTIGWLTAPSGSFVASEPVGAKSFFPCNDHPSDKAMFTISVTAPAAKTVVANGTLTAKEAGTDGTTRWTFGQTVPMATYLVQIAVGDYDIVESTGPHGLPIRHAVVRDVSAAQRRILDETAAQIEYFEPLFGPYPFDTYGVLVADAPPDFALETQTLTLLPASWLADDTSFTSGVLAHELSHQWFGDAVSLSRWTDIWLNEGFATYAEWLWVEHDGGATVDAQANRARGQATSWRQAFGPVASPAAPVMFSPNEYDGAAIVLHALRRTLGDAAFFELLRGWVTDHDGSSATTADFESRASQVAGRDLTAFFDAWLRSTTVPPFP